MERGRSPPSDKLGTGKALICCFERIRGEAAKNEEFSHVGTGFGDRFGCPLSCWSGGVPLAQGAMMLQLMGAIFIGSFVLGIVFWMLLTYLKYWVIGAWFIVVFLREIILHLTERISHSIHHARARK